MKQFFGYEDIKSIIRLSPTSLRLPTDSSIRIGGRGAVTEIDLDCDLTTNGVGGLDIGSLVADTVYYIYAVIVSDIPYLVCSVSSNGPTGFLVFSEIGKVLTDFNSELYTPLNKGGILEMRHHIRLKGGQASMFDKTGEYRWFLPAYLLDDDNNHGPMLDLIDNVGDTRTEILLKIDCFIEAHCSVSPTLTGYAASIGVNTTTRHVTGTTQMTINRLSSVTLKKNWIPKNNYLSAGQATQSAPLSAWAGSGYHSNSVMAVFSVMATRTLIYDELV